MWIGFIFFDGFLYFSWSSSYLVVLCERSFYVVSHLYYVVMKVVLPQSLVQKLVVNPLALEFIHIKFVCLPWTA